MNLKKSKRLHYFMLNSVVYGLMGILSFIIIQYFHFSFDFAKVIGFIDENTKLSILSIGVILIFQIPITILLGNVWLSAMVTLFVSFIIGFANFQKMLYRPEPLFPSDVSMLKDIKFLFFSIENKDRVVSIIAIMITMGIIIFLAKNVYSGQKLTFRKLLIRLLAFFVSLGFLYPVMTFGKSNNAIKNTFESFGNVSWIPFNQILNYDQNGVIAGLLYNLSSQVIEQPENYSKEKVQEVVNKYRNLAATENETRTGSLEDINIVYIMNESFADPMVFEGWTITPDPLPKYREIIQGTSSGQMLSQGYGGGTANIEFEALTGISLEPMLPNISIVYTQLTDKLKQVPTLMDYMDHHKTAIHPFQSSMYKRPDVYQNMGFDAILFDEDMDFDDKLESSLYISDEASYNQVYKVMEESKEKDFIHLVTMQGHGPYYVGYFGNIQGFEVDGPVQKMDMLNYLASLSYSDDALKGYTNKVNSMDEKVLTVFWGDHLPSAIGYGITSLNEPIQKYLTPMFIHTNYDSESKELDITSPIYYMNEILDQTNSPLTGYYALLRELRKYIPAFEKEFHIYSDVGDIGTERIHNFDSDAAKILSEYDLLIYDIFEGNGYFEAYGFFE